MTTVKNNLEFVAFDGSIVEIIGEFIVGHLSDGSPSFLGYAKLTGDNREALQTLNHGAKPVIEFNDKGEEKTPVIESDPILGLPLWKYVKPSKANNTIGRTIPVQSAYNRETKQHQVTTLRQSLVRKGWDTKVRVVSLVTREGYTTLGDAGHLLTALAQTIETGHDFESKHKEGKNKGQYVNELNESNVIMLHSLNFIQGEEGHDNTIEGFDELQSPRTVRDMLGKLNLAPGWEREVQEVLSKLCLLCSGKTVGGSGKSLPHLTDELGKVRKLAESETASLFLAKIPGFERIRQCLDALNEISIRVLADADNAEYVDCPLHEYPTFNRYSISSWILAIIECSYSSKLSIDSIVKELGKRIANDSDPITIKVNSWAATKGKGDAEYQYPILCSLIFGMFDENHGGAPLPTRKPVSRSSCLVKIAYDSWHDKQSQ
jgi:hypothetical protein